MTATEKAVALLHERGRMTPEEFGQAMWPRVARESDRLPMDAGVFLTRLAKLGYVRKVGRRYGV